MTLDLAAIDLELDALAVGLDLRSSARARRVDASIDFDSVDAELAALESGVHIVMPQRPAAPTASAPLSAAALFEEETSTSLHVDLSQAEEVVARPPSNAPVPLSADALFGDDVPIHEAPTRELGGLDFDDPGRGVTVSPDLAALLEGELDPSDFGPPRPSHASEPAYDGAQSVASDDSEVALEEGELEVLIDDVEVSAESDRTEPLPATDTSPSLHPEAESPRSTPPEPGEKKGFFKKIFGK